jgi:cytoskeletal protein RodZ
MDWIINHLFIFVFVAIGVANMLAKAKRAGAQQRPPKPARSSLDPDTTERTRRVQEEIRRKIAERAGRPPIVSPPPSAGPPPQNIFQELARQMAEAKRTAEMSERAQAAAEAQAQQGVEDERKSREQAEARQMAEVQRTLQRQQQAATTVVAYSGTTAVSARDKLLASLREPDSLRRAWLLREILGEPVGLR